MTRLIRASADPRLMLAAAATLVGMGAGALILTRASAAEVPPVIELPARKADAAPALVETPAVPPEADHVQTVRFALETTWPEANGTRRTVQRVTRSADRVHLVLEDGQREWLFTRNPVFPDRVSGLLIDHARRRIEQHDDSDLQRQLLLRGWADVLTMRVDPRQVASLADTGERRTVAGITFHHHRAAGEASGLVDAWWSPSLLLALEQTTRESNGRSVTTRVVGLTLDVDPSVFASPAERFPAYERLDAADGNDHGG